MAVALKRFLCSVAALVKTPNANIMAKSASAVMRVRCISDSDAELSKLQDEIMAADHKRRGERKQQAVLRKKSHTRPASREGRGSLHLQPQQAQQAPALRQSNSVDYTQLPAFGRRLSLISNRTPLCAASNDSLYTRGPAASSSDLYPSQPQKSVLRDIVDAEISLVTLAMSIFFYISANRFSPFLLLNGLLLLPLFVGGTLFLSFWVALFVLCGRVFLGGRSQDEGGADQLDVDWLTERADSVVSSSGISSMASNDMLSNNGSEASSTPMLYFRSTRKMT